MSHIKNAALVTALAVITALWSWISLVSGGLSPGLCGAPMCGYIPGHANVTFISLGFLSAFLFGVECLNLATRKRQWNTGYESPNQRKIRRFGLGSILLGVSFAVYGLYELNTTIMGCNAFGCGSLPISYYFSFYIGLCLVAIGAVSMLASKLVQPGFKLPSQIVARAQRV